MSKMPPNRRGINFEVGAALEACDSLKNWYAANIEKIDYEDEKVLIHYRQWSHRYDEWFDWGSPYLRPVERVQLRRKRLQQDCSLPGFHVNDKVLASWSDCRFYPAKVLAVHKDASYTVKFYDGFVQTVKGMHVRPFIKERVKQKSQSFDRSGEKHQFKMTEKHPRPQERASHKTKRGSQHACEPESESDSDSADERMQRKSEKRPVRTNSAEHEVDRINMPERDGPEQAESPAEHMGQHNYSKSFVKTSTHREQEEESGAMGDHDPSSGLDDRMENQDVEKKTELPEQRENAVLQSRTAEGSPVGGKRRCLVDQSDTSFKKIKVESYSDKCLHGQSRPSSELSKHTLCENGLECAPLPSAEAQSSNGTAALKTEAQSEGSQHLPTPPAKPARKQGFHNPNRFSREPLYRVIKNQPPPALSINLDHNPFKCSIPGCGKSFRKAKLLHYHMKYYHGDEGPVSEDLRTAVGVHTRAAGKQSSLASWQSSKRRRTMALSLYTAAHSHAHSSSSPRLEGWSAAQTAYRRQTLAPPAVSMQEPQPRALPKEKSREKQQDRNRSLVDKDRKTTAETVCVKDRDRPKDKKSRSFLHIKLKKKKKKKSKSGSEENIDISVFGPQSKSNLPHKPLPCPAQLSEVFRRSRGRGRGRAQQIQVDDEGSISDWSSDSYGWTDDDIGADLDITARRLSCGSVDSATVARETVRCVCEVAEENDFMIQCEACMHWQHGACMGLLADTVPDAYACFVCRDPPGQRLSLRYWYDQDWLSHGHMVGLPFLEENYSHQNARKIVATHQLLGDVQHVLEVLSSLQLKINILQNESHPDLKLWSRPWHQTGAGGVRGVFTMASAATRTPAPADKGLHRSGSTTERLRREPSSSLSSSFHNSYISSEHCYQKPRACYAVLEAEIGGSSEPQDSSRGSEPQDSPRGVEQFLQYEQHNGEEPQPCQSKERKERDTEMQVATVISGSEEPKSNSQQQQRINLLDHIECLQDEVTHRMDFIEKELDVLESWLDYSGELEPPEPLARLPELKHSIKQLLGDLGKMQQIAISCST
ncbi:PHD finger protein 20 [Electrophorus electricus]|uniref:PHD finger protein 20 n=1 Tax=Electrophorus electricus TaxID=8005 RepID=UPI0015CFA652|nr:PHD finger protein 20 [Electrophorus electricus]